MNNNNELRELAQIDSDFLNCFQDSDCKKERTISYALGVDIPTEPEDLERIFEECCYSHNVFATEDSSENYKNDYSAFYHQKQLPNETVSFVLKDLNNDDEYNLDDDTFGKFFGFGFFSTNENLSGYKLEWKDVLEYVGVGNYKVIKRINIAGVEVEFPSYVFTLKRFNQRDVDKTVKIEVVMNGLLVKNKVDFSGTNFKHSIRVPGFFGRREPQFEEDVLIDREFNKDQISIKQTNEYKFQTNLIPSCITEEIFDFILMANKMFVTDYNANNHSYNYKRFDVNVSTNEGTGYNSQSRKAQINLIFTDGKENNLKRSYY